jgi:hypothetical protein
MISLIRCLFSFLLFIPNFSYSQYHTTSTLYAGQYNYDLSLTMMDYSMAAYCSPDKLENWQCGTPCIKHPDIIDLSLIENTKYNIQGFTMYNPKNNYIILSFRGTEPTSIKNWIDDIDFVMTDFYYCNNCKVHKGFYTSYDSVRNDTMSLLNNLIYKYNNPYIYLTGHSLGGALATIACAELLNLNYNIKSLYTFGSPRVGNKEFFTMFSEFNNLDSIRITHYADIVPHLPLYSWGFNHVSREVWFNRPNSEYIICDLSGEDNKCSNSIIDLSIPDHLTYMNFSTAGYVVTDCSY